MQSSQNVVNSIMSKIAVKRLRFLRRELESSKVGLTLEQFIEAAIRNMALKGEEELLQTIPDVVDLFQVIDVNGDGSLEWKEFVSFLIDQVVKMSSHAPINERLARIKSAPGKGIFGEKVQVCKVFFGRLFVASGNQIHIYSLDATSSNWIAEDSAKILIEGDEVFEGNLRQEDVTVLDFAFLEAEDVLLILRSDKYIQSIRFTTRTKLTSDSIFFMGIFRLPFHCFRVEVREMAKEPYKLFAVGVNFTVDCWTVTVRPGGKVIFENHATLQEVHTDFVRDILVTHLGHHKLFITGSLDRTWAAYDLDTLRYRYTRSGNLSNGIRCLGYDGKGLLLAGCLDFTIAAWDLDSELDIPLFILRGHSSAVVKIVALPMERCFSLDVSGELRLWNTSMDDFDHRLIDCRARSDDHFHSFDVFRGVPSQFQALYGVVVAACGRQCHLYKLLSTESAEDPPFMVLYSHDLLTIVTVHPKDIFLWDAVTGELFHRVRNAGGIRGGELTAAVFNSKSQKLICGDSLGTISVINCFNGVKLDELVVSPGRPVRWIFYSVEKLILLLCGDGEIFLVDDEPNLSELSIIRSNRIVERYIVTMAYSQPLGIFAVADAEDNVMIYDFEFFSLELTIRQCTGNKVTMLFFIENYPLLLVCNSFGSFVCVPMLRDVRKLSIWRMGISALQPRETPHEKAASLARREDFVREKSSALSIACITSKATLAYETYYGAALRRSLGGTLSTRTSMKEVDHVDILVGYNDGSAVKYDFTEAISIMGPHPLTPSSYASSKPGYLARRKVNAETTEFSLQRTSFLRSTIRRNERRATVSMTEMWQAHYGRVISLLPMRDGEHLLTGSDNREVRVWTVEGKLLGTLTEGSKLDQGSNQPWTSPVDMALCQKEKRELAIVLRNKLNLKLAAKESGIPPSPIKPFIHALRFNPLDSSVSSKSHPTLSATSLYCEMCRRPPRERVLGQLTGVITYKQSVKDVHIAAVGSQAENLERSLQAIQLQVLESTEKKKRGKRRKKTDSFLTRGGMTAEEVEAAAISATNDDAEYMESIIGQNVFNGNAATRTLANSRTRYDAEISRIDAKDPLNWEINTLNKQREIYVNLYRELTAKGLARDQIAMLDKKLNGLSPGGDFYAYLRKLRDELPPLSASVSSPPSLMKSGESMGSSHIYSRPKCDISTIKPPSSHPIMSMSLPRLASSSIKKSTLKTPLRSSVRQPPRLLAKMASDLNADMKATYIANHNEVQQLYSDFDKELKDAERSYRKAKRVHKKESRRRRVERLAQTATSLGA